jgi:DnaJ-class molecular chaperone
MRSVKTECDSCGGTGVYSGFLERESEGIVCVSCSGTGCETIYYTPFTKQKIASNIKTVWSRRGAAAGGESSITYVEFKKGVRP